MTTITGKRIITFTAGEGETYEIVYSNPYLKVNISNLTEGTIYVNDTNDFAETDGAGSYIAIAAGGFYNKLFVQGSKLYIKAESTGQVTIVRCS